MTPYQEILWSVLTSKFGKIQTQGLDEIGQWGDALTWLILGSMCLYEVLTRECFVCTKTHVSLILGKKTNLVYPFHLLYRC